MEVVAGTVGTAVEQYKQNWGTIWILEENHEEKPHEPYKQDMSVRLLHWIWKNLKNFKF